MFRSHRHFGRAAMVIALLALFGAGPARAWEYPLLPHVNGLAFFPETPNSESQTRALLSAYYPNQCFVLVDSTLTDSAHVRVTIEPRNTCTDTVSTWTRMFNLGILAAGMHQLTVHCTVLQPGQASLEEEIRVPFEVVNASYPPPPPPPPPIDSSRAGVSASHPNPFRDQSSFSVSLDDAQNVDVAVFDLLGRRVTTIHRGMLPQGTSNLAWNGRRQDGSRAPGGIYFYRLTLPDRVVQRQVVLLGAP